MQLFDLEIRQDWQELEHLRINEHIRLWRLIQFVVIVSTAAVFLVSFLPLAAPWGNVLHYSLTFAFFLAFTLWSVCRSEVGSPRIFFFTYLLFVGAAVIAGFTSNIPAAGTTRPVLPPWPGQFVYLLPLMAWFVLIWSWKQFPALMSHLGFFPDRWVLNIIVGAASGGSLGFHFLLAAYLFSGLSSNNLLSLSVFSWTLFFRLGLGALGEEFLLRGMAFPLLFEKSDHSFWKAAWQIAVLNVMIYIVPILNIPGTFWGLWMMIYLVVFSFISTLLRFRHGSLFACIACNITFHLVIGMVF